MQTYASKKKSSVPAAQGKATENISKSDMLRMSGAGAPQPMSATLREKFEPGFGADFSNIRISRGHILEEMGVQAVAKGTDILIDSRAGMDVLGHELAHVVQQAQGQVQGGFPVVHDAALEHQADVMGARVASGMSAMEGGMSGFGGGEMMSIAPMSGESAPAQCKSRAEKKQEKADKAAMKDMNSRYDTLVKDTNARLAANPDDEKALGISNKFLQGDTAIGKIDALEYAGERSQKIQARSGQFFNAHESYSAGPTTRDLVRFLGNGTDEDMNVTDERMDSVYQAVRGSEASVEEPQRHANAQKLIKPFQDSVSVLRSQMEPLLKRHNKKASSKSDIAMRYKETAEIYKKAQITRDIGSQLMKSGAIQEGDPQYDQLMSDLNYARDLCQYVIKLNTVGKGVEKGSAKLEDSMTFDQVQSSMADQRAKAAAVAAPKTAAPKQTTAPAQAGWKKADVSDAAYNQAPQQLAGAQRNPMNKLKKLGFY